MRQFLSLAATFVLLNTAFISAARADDSCALTVEANDLMQFNQKTMTAGNGCNTVQVTLKHVGKLAKTVMGHDWVLASTKDVGALVSAGAAAGLKNNYLPPGDKRVIAFIPVIGGGETLSVTVPMTSLQPGGDYTFFCSYPGHTSMRGKFVAASRGGLVDIRTSPAGSGSDKPAG